MQLSKEAVEEFKQCWRDEYQSEISEEEANRIGVSLLELVKLIIKPKINESKK